MEGGRRGRRRRRERKGKEKGEKRRTHTALRLVCSPQGVNTDSQDPPLVAGMSITGQSDVSETCPEPSWVWPRPRSTLRAKRGGCTGERWASSGCW